MHHKMLAASAYFIFFLSLFTYLTFISDSSKVTG